jgi:propionyl-CoA carboxylase alpha chain
MADESYLIGPAPARQSYLNSKIIIDTALASGAQAIHPGYGFLSENAEFAKAVEAAGLAFIGPKAKVIRLMGDKLEAKALARQAKVSMIPGSETPVTTVDEVKALGSQLGYPLLLKAAAGGGGKGMRVVEGEEQIDDLLQRTSHEALTSFGDGRIFVEKYVDAPRHIEIQILADTKGNIIHLGERDCSLQRRHQKVMEECPSPFMTPQLRKAMTDQAIALARKVGYTSAGTVEFMVTKNHEFYFLEMNTRLQVEHPVTEMVTGLDLVEQMIRIAAGESLSVTQDQISFSGHAIEARLYAEDAGHDFMPSSGRITRFEAPICNEGLRLDTGVVPGSEVSIYYDPMIAKLIAWAPHRLDAIQRLKQSLAQFMIEGPIHNAGFLEQLLHQPKVIAGDFTTQFIEQEMIQDLSEKQKCLVKAIAAMIHQRHHPKDISSEWFVVEQGEGTRVKLNEKSVTVGKTKIPLDLRWQPVERRFVVQVQDETSYGQVHLENGNITIRLFGIDTTLQVMRPKMWDLFSHVRPPDVQIDNLVVKAPMPGILISLPISVGDRVKLGQPLLVIEAMKMENVLKSPAEAVVSEIYVQPGESLARNQVLVKLS